MGLTERRALKEFVDHQYPDLVKRVEKAAGYKLEVETEWDMLVTVGPSTLYATAWPQVYFNPLVAALELVASDPLGREALKKGLKKVVITNTKGIYGEKAFTFEQGELRIDHLPTSNIQYEKERREAIRKVLEKNL